MATKLKTINYPAAFEELWNSFYSSANYVGSKCRAYEAFQELNIQPEDISSLKEIAKQQRCERVLSKARGEDVKDMSTLEKWLNDNYMAGRVRMAFKQAVSA